MAYHRHRSPGVRELLTLRTQLNSLIDRLVAAEIDLPSSTDPTGYFPSPLPEIPQIAAVAEQIKALVLGPSYTLQQAFVFHIPSCLRIAIEAHVEETLREAEEQGKNALHVRTIAKSSAICPEKLARILRLLAATHIFREVGLDTFARNRCSTALDTGKSVAELKSTKDFFYGTSGFAALIAHTADEVFKASAYAAEAVLSPSTANSYDIRDAPFNLAYRDDGDTTIFEHFARKKNAHCLTRFDAAVKYAGIAFSGGQENVLIGYPWANLREGAVIVDVGAGIGQVALTLAETFSDVRVVVQDLPDVIRDARPFWKASAPRDIESGRVTLMEHDFFEEQPVRRADVYVLRAIVHDWADEQAVQILQRLAEAASSTSDLVVIEQPLNYLCSPNPFPPVSMLPYLMDLQMLTAVNALERTQPQYQALASKAGWQLVKVWKTGRDGTSDGPYRHYHFRLAPEMVKSNKKRSDEYHHNNKKKLAAATTRATATATIIRKEVSSSPTSSSPASPVLRSSASSSTTRTNGMVTRITA